MAQLVLAAAGAAVSTAAGFGPGIGWAIGYGLGYSLAPTKQIRREAAKLDNLRVTGTEYGQMIPWVSGSPRISGQLWYASIKRPVAHTTHQHQGKGGSGGGQTVTTTIYTYDIDLLIGLTDNIIQGVTRIWEDGKLIYNIRSDAGPATIAASLASPRWARLTVYTGAPTQLPDPTYEAAVGTENAPAYRGRGSLFIESLHLGEGGQLTNLTFEVNGPEETYTYVSTLEYASAEDISSDGSKVLISYNSPAVPDGYFKNRTGIFSGGVLRNIGFNPARTDSTLREDAYCISGNGVVVGAGQNSAGQIWDSASDTWVEFLAAGTTPYPRGLSSDGSKAVIHAAEIHTAGSSNAGHSNYWERGVGLTSLPVLPYTPTITYPKYAYATGISNNGLVVACGSFVWPNAYACIWHPGDSTLIDLNWPSWTTITDFGHQGQTVNGISGNGNVVFGARDMQGPQYGVQACYYNIATHGFHNLGWLPGGILGNWSIAEGSNYDGSVIVGWSEVDQVNYEQKAFKWTAATGMVRLPDPPGEWHYLKANACSADGSIIVGYGEQAPDYNGDALMWKNGTVYILSRGVILDETRNVSPV